MSTGLSFRFGPFCLVPEEGLLLKDDKSVRLGSRALELLTALVERDGELVSKDELMARVWPNTVVDDGSLRAQVVAVRKALGDGVTGDRYVRNVPGRGYRFQANILPVAGRGIPKIPAGADDYSNTLPGRISRLIGRDDAVAAVANKVSEKRFVTIVGPGGVGKTTVAVAVSHTLAASFGQAMRFLNFSTLSNPELLSSTVASSFGLQVGASDPLPYLIGFLREKRMLIVLDSCEHVIDAAATLAQRIFHEATDVCLLVTSREPLRVEGENVFRLAPLETPPAKADLSAQQALCFPVVQLFIERASAAASEFKLTDTNAPTVAEICRRLDGIPLAIELAAARTGAFGVTAVAAGLTNMFGLLIQGRRTALPRHQTLHATLDWSHELLATSERVILRRLAVFCGSFQLETGVALATDPSLPTPEVLEGISNLTSKSLLTADLNREVAQYRLLDTTRAYAREKLAASGETADIARRHASLCCSIFENAERDWEVQAKDKWLEFYAGRIDCLRAALDWAFSPDGDAALGIALTAVSAPLWSALSLHGEYCDRGERALRHIAQAPLSGSELEMKLNLALSAATYNARGSPSRMAEAPARALEIAEQRGDQAHQLRALWQLARERYTQGDYRKALALCEQFERVAIASGDDEALLIRDRIMALALHSMGRHAEGRVYAERAMKHPGSQVRNTHKSFNELDGGVATRSHLARIVWVQGLPDQAATLAADGVNLALALGYKPPACQVLVYAACPIAFWTGNVAASRRYLRLLSEQSADFPYGYWQTWRRLYEQVAAFVDKDFAPASHSDASSLLDSIKGAHFADTIGTFRTDFVSVEAIARATAGDSGWCAAEILRGQGVNILRQGSAKEAGRAERLFEQSLALARQQGALSWEIRSATSLAQLWNEQGRREDARALLASVYEQFTEGFQTADLVAAKRLLDELSFDRISNRAGEPGAGR